MVEINPEEKKRIILDIMIDIDDFCRAHNLPYVISSGTLLGAVRHGGFIPWDDDADMFMLREDFDRFISLYKNRKYHLLYNADSEEESFRLGFVKVCEPNTYMIRDNSKFRHGVYVDIFPLDYVPEDEKERNNYMGKLIRYQHGLRHRQKKDFLSVLTSYFHSVDWWWEKVDKTIRSSNYNDSRLVAHIVGSRNKKTVFDRNWLKNLKEIDFEGRKFLTFADTHSYLTMVYGDYMTPPPENQRRGHAREKFYKK
ncbi:MAG: LicD family protein [Muribaculaceae bacterium]|nr:LicD family protein [Muribaculaceae bacterium]